MGNHLSFLAIILSALLLIPTGIKTVSTLVSKATPTPSRIEKEIKAYESIAFAKNWAEIFNSYTKYKEYDDGYIAEAYSDTIVRTLAYNWSTRNDLFELMDRDAEFKSFVLKHVDASAAYSDLEKIIANSLQDCTDNNQSQCIQIKEQAYQAICQILSISR